ncbi:MAG: MBOAT family protein [Peptococcaceae bacterium]|nr:MBOAT family protein [Peptococcaceae bacterium]
MVFSGINFLFYFLPCILLLYYLAPRKCRNFLLFLGSLFFYAWGEPVYVGLMIFSSVVDYLNGLGIERNRERKTRAKLFLWLSVFINLALLGFFKYADFLILNINQFLGTALPLLELPLPIGISFYTFQTMSYTIDVYRNETPVQRNFIAFATYVSLFPQLIAGPIVRYRDVAEQMLGRKESISLFAAGVERFLIGLGKKVLLANNMGFIWSELLKIPVEQMSLATAWLGVIAFTFQIYFDFSGYSDMAIGLGKMFGFTFPENFRYPYVSKSISEFWRRWHISLGTWFREYVYIPLGGNRCRKLLQYRNIFAVWFLTGLWHGANWNFILWGLYFGVIIMAEKAFLQKFLNKLPSWVQHAYALFFICFGWVLFYFEDGRMLEQYVLTLFGGYANPWLDNHFLYYLTSYGVLWLAALLGSTPLLSSLWQRAITTVTEKRQVWKMVFLLCLKILALFAVLLMAVAYLVNDSYNPFLYFRF